MGAASCKQKGRQTPLRQYIPATTLKTETRNKHFHRKSFSAQNFNKYKLVFTRESKKRRLISRNTKCHGEEKIKNKHYWSHFVIAVVIESNIAATVTFCM